MCRMGECFICFPAVQWDRRSISARWFAQLMFTRCEWFMSWVIYTLESICKLQHYLEPSLVLAKLLGGFLSLANSILACYLFILLRQWRIYVHDLYVKFMSLNFYKRLRYFHDKHYLIIFCSCRSTSKMVHLNTSIPISKMLEIKSLLVCFGIL